MKDKRYRSLLKGITWRIVATADTFVISWLVTGKIMFALSISGIEVITKLTLYYFHERAWDKIKVGKEETPIEYNI